MNLSDVAFFSPNARRVRRSEVSSGSFIKPDGLDYCLDCWKSWMGGDPDRDMGVKTMRGLAGDDVRNLDISEAQQANDSRIGAATDAMISSLPTIQVWAIKRACSIASVWKFENADFVVVASEAKEALTEKLKKNICTSVLF